VLALGANVGLSGLNLPPLASTLLPPLTGAAVGVGVYEALKRWVMGPVDDEYPPAREIKGQIKRIRRKARELKREAARAGGVFNGLDVKADRLAAEADELTDRLFELRDVARDVRRKMGDAARAGGPQERVHELLSRNRAAQRQCLVQLERIEDLLDVARLEVACPDEQMPPDRGREELVQEVETELEAARRALEEVQRQSQTV
jgi:chromosome segregation ATPase